MAKDSNSYHYGPQSSSGSFEVVDVDMPPVKSENSGPKGDNSQRRNQLESGLPTSSVNPNIPSRLSSPSTATEAGFETIGHNIKIYVDTIAKLQHYDLPHGVELPNIVFVGDQSAGKSSLMSSMAQMNLPRQQGCCTRVPMNITIKDEATWSCKVSLQEHWEYKNPGQKILKPTAQNPFPPWVPHGRGQLDFKKIEVKTDLEEVLRCAQLALLNPSQDYRQFIPGTGAHLDLSATEAEFSPNVVLVEIAGPGLQPLSFFDLPGIIHNAPTSEKQYLVTVFENLAKLYIKNTSAIVVYAMTMSVDPDLSRTGRIINDMKATDRTIGILTKPDTLKDLNDFRKVLENKEHVLGHGYFVTKQPGPDSELDSADPNYHLKARRDEDGFFDTHPLWSDEWSQYRDRCGTLAIQKYLGQELARQTAQKIPDFERKIAIRSKEVEEALLALPSLPAADTYHLVLRRLMKFSKEVQTLIDGESMTDNTFQSDWSDLTQQFRSIIFYLKPKIIMADASDKNEFPDPVIEISDSEEEPKDGGGFATPRKRPHEQPGVKTPQERFKTETPSSAHRSTPPSRSLFSAPTGRVANRAATEHDKTPFAGYVGSITTYSIGEIRKQISIKSRAGLSNVPTAKVYDYFTMKSVAAWDGPLEVLLEDTVALLKRDIMKVHREVFKDWQQTPLYRESRDLVCKLLNDHQSLQMQVLRDLYQRETFRSFTINSTMHKEFERSELAELLKKRTIVRGRHFVNQQLLVGEKKLAKNLDFQDRAKAKYKLISEVKEQDMAADPFQDEIEVAAYVRGYYLTAAHRFVDSSCLSIYSLLFKNIHRSIDGYLEKEFGLHANDGHVRCGMLMEDDPQVAQHRTQLQKKQKNLADISAQLRQLRKDMLVSSDDRRFLNGRMQDPVEEMARDREMDLRARVEHEDHDMQ